MRLRKVFAFPILVLALTGCAAHKVESVNREATKHTGLSFLKNGQTNKEDTFSGLGIPSAQFEKGRILSYRLDKKYRPVSDLVNRLSKEERELEKLQQYLAEIETIKRKLQQKTQVEILQDIFNGRYSSLATTGLEQQIERQQQLINEINAALKAIFTKPEYLRTIPTEKRVKIQRIIDNAAQRKDVSKSLDGKRGLSPGPVLQDPKAQWEHAQYNLVLVFDSADLLETHNLVRVR